MTERTVSACRVLLAFSVALSPPLATVSRALTSSLPAGRQSASEQGRDDAIRQVENLFNALEEAAALIPGDSFDPRALAARLGTDPAQHFEWVRDHTDWVPYRGALRGPTGVVMDRLGNSLDRALLLAEMLAAAGHSVRLAHDEIPVGQAQELLGRVRTARLGQSIPVVRTPEFSAALWGISERHGLSVEEMRSDYETRLHRNVEASALAAERTSTQAQFLAATVAGVVQPVDRANDAAEALRDHWWVQIRTDRQWSDLDPLLPYAQVGDSLTEDPRTVPYRKRNGLIVLERGTSHEVEIRVIVEQSRNGRRREREALSHVLRPHDLAGGAVTLFAVATHASEALDPSDPAGMLEQLQQRSGSAGEWLPVLRVGSETLYNLAFTAEGSVKRPDLSLFAGSQEAFEGALGQLDLLGQSLDRATSVDKASATTFASGAWVEYEIRGPGIPTRTLRRTLFDLLGPDRDKDNVSAAIGPAQRLAREVALTGSIDILAQGSAITPDLVEATALNGLLASRALTLDALRNWDPEQLRRRAESVDVPGPVPLSLFSLAIARTEWGNATKEVYIASPNVLTYRSGYEVAVAGELRRYGAFDIVANDVAAVSGSGHEAFDARMRQGVLDTNAEALLLPPGQSFASTASALSASSDPSRDWVLITDANDVAWGESPTAEVARRLIATDLEAGYAVVVPRTPNTERGPGWWRIDPATGTTLGMIDGGGQASVEYVTLVLRLSMCYMPISSDAFVSALLCVLFAGRGYLNPDSMINHVAWFGATFHLVGLELLTRFADQMLPD